MVDFFLKGNKIFEITPASLSAAKNVMLLKIFLTERRIIKDLVFKNLQMTRSETETVCNLLESLDSDQLKTLVFEK